MVCLLCYAKLKPQIYSGIKAIPKKGNQWKNLLNIFLECRTALPWKWWEDEEGMYVKEKKKRIIGRE